MTRSVAGEFGVALLKGLQRIGLVVSGAVVLVGLLAVVGALLPTPPAWFVPPEWIGESGATGTPMFVWYAIRGFVWWFCFAAIAAGVAGVAVIGGFGRKHAATPKIK